MSSIDNAKAVMGYIKATRRRGCKDCLHAEERPCIHPTWWCTKGDFLTSPMAICQQHTPVDGGAADVE
jgi:hypothetical protein